MANYEVEIKSLIGSKQNADELVTKMKTNDSGFASLGTHKQLNHYFVKGDLPKLRQKLSSHLLPEKQKQFDELVLRAKDFSVRTRWADSKVLFVIKATVDDTTSSNGTARHEFESELNLNLDQLDQVLLDCGFEYQAKWSREREDYSYKGLNVSVDKNAGYGFVAEFEAITDEAGKTEELKKQIRDYMKELEVAELPQERLERMFKFYNEHWQEYYGTDKTFNIE